MLRLPGGVCVVGGGGKGFLFNVGSRRNPGSLFPAEVGCWVDSWGRGWRDGVSETFLAVENHSFCQIFFVGGGQRRPPPHQKKKKKRVLGLAP